MVLHIVRDIPKSNNNYCFRLFNTLTLSEVVKSKEEMQILTSQSIKIGDRIYLDD